jgi:photosynthetic reaction center cytochrome c subunit
MLESTAWPSSSDSLQRGHRGLIGPFFSEAESRSVFSKHKTIRIRIDCSPPSSFPDALLTIQVLKGIPENEFMETMGFFSASLGVNCDYCHNLENDNSWDAYAKDNAHKQTARRMILMMTAINKANFGGQHVVTCYSCHRGGETPMGTPSIAQLYGAPPPDDPDEMPLGRARGTVSADQVLDKYIQALGGAQRLASLTSFVAKGTYEGYSASEKGSVEVFAKAPDERTTIIHTLSGDTTTTYDGRAGWIAAPETLAPVTVLALTGGDLEAAKVDADLSFPARIKQALVGWRIGSPATINDREVQVVQGTTSGQSPVRLYFDGESGLLVRLVRYTDSPVGLNPTEIDYSDYREVSGIKIPFHWTVSWLDGRSTFELSDVQLNASIDAARFARPAPPAPPKTTTP